MRHKTTQTLFAYFNRIRNGNSAPLRADISPAELKTVLPDIFMLEMARSGSPVFRLAGTRVCAIMGRELRGEDFKYVWHGTHRHKMKLAAEAVIANVAPLDIQVRSDGDEEENGDLEMLLMPLASRPGIVDRLFGSLVDLSQPPLRVERPRELMARSVSFIAPDQSIEPEDAALSVATQISSLRARVMHLKLLQGGRKD